MTPLTYAAAAGLLIPLAVSLISHASWSSNAKRWLTLGLAAAFTIAGVAFAYYPDAWTEIGAMLAVTVGVAQTIYAILKPTGALDWFEAKTELPKRAQVEDEPETEPSDA